jgi:YidC/Oxa1 family membrane protein insertase
MDKRTIAAIVLSLAVIIIYQTFLIPPPPKQAPPGPAAAPTTAPAPLPRVDAAAPAPEVVAPPPDLAVLVQGQEGEVKTVNVGTPLARFTLSSRGGSLTSLKLTHHRNQEGEALEMVPVPEPGDPLPLAVLFQDEALRKSFTEGNWRTEGGDLVLSPENPRGSVTFSRYDASGILVVKKFSFRHDAYGLETQVEVRNLGAAPREVAWWIQWSRDVGRDQGVPQTGPPTPLALVQGGTMTEKPKKEGERSLVPGGFLWAGLPSTYFLAAYISDAHPAEAFFQRLTKDGFGLGVGPVNPVIPAGGAALVGGRWFIGPKSLEILKAEKAGLELSVDFGWFGSVGKALMAVLTFFHRYAGNWGVAIIFLTITVKLLLFPVTYHMYKSMRRMQEFQPHVQALKKKYKDDSQALNQEIMALYKQHNINPAGGCFPMLIQLPVFFALYRVLAVTYELRGASFLHIRDLSQGETTLGQFIHGLAPFFPEGILPLKVFVLLMGVTMFIQQKMSPAMTDPKQAKVMMFLPVIFTAMFWNFTSGLVVYFLCSSLISIGEQVLIKKLTSRASTAQA